MRGYVSSDKASVIIDTDLKDEITKKVTSTWQYIFVMLGFFTVLTLALLVMSIGSDLKEVMRAILFLVLMGAADVFVIKKYIQVHIKSGKEFKAQVEKYGHNELVAQMLDSSSVAYFVVEGVYRYLIVVTADYLISANDFVYPLKDIDTLELEEHYVPEEKVERMAATAELEDVFRNMFKIKISFKDGTHEETLISVRRQDIRDLVMELRSRAPQAVIKCSEIADDVVKKNEYAAALFRLQNFNDDSIDNPTVEQILDYIDRMTKNPEEEHVGLSLDNPINGISYIQAIPLEDGYDLQLGIGEGDDIDLICKTCSLEELKERFLKFYKTADVDDRDKFEPYGY